jgi:hypothetical protein
LIWPLFAVAVATGYLLRAALPFPVLGRTAAGGLMLLLAAGLALIVAMLRPRLDAFLKGAEGEEWVARELMFLPSSYRVFHGVVLRSPAPELQHGDLDHVAVGPTGVFVIETKNWSGRVTVEKGRILYNGREPDRAPLDQVRQAAEALRQGLRATLGFEVNVSPILCFAASTFEGETLGVSGVIVCNARYLSGVIEDSMDRPMEDELIARISEHLRLLCA